jgi:hypothetical protein
VSFESDFLIASGEIPVADCAIKATRNGMLTVGREGQGPNIAFVTHKTPQYPCLSQPEEAQGGGVRHEDLLAVGGNDKLGENATRKGNGRDFSVGCEVP